MPKFCGETPVRRRRPWRHARHSGSEACETWLKSNCTRGCRGDVVESEDKPERYPKKNFYGRRHDVESRVTWRKRSRRRTGTMNAPEVIDLIRVVSHKPGSLYLAGLPPGKTLTLKDVPTTERWGISGKTRPRVVFINCMSLSRSQVHLWCDFTRSTDATNHRVNPIVSPASGAPNSAMFRKSSASSSRDGTQRCGCIILLDEMDQLADTERREACVRTSRIARFALKESRCVLAGVSNAINLTDRVLPRFRVLGASCLKPALARSRRTMVNNSRCFSNSDRETAVWN